MNWKDLGRIVLSQAPLLGAALGGPAGLAIKAGAALANRVGAPDNASPDEIAAILQDTDIGKIGREMEHEIRMFTVESERDSARAQAEISKIEAAKDDTFVSGPRPAAKWVCVAGIAYHYIIRPIANGFGGDFPAIEIEALMALFAGMGGMYGFRSWEKSKGVARSRL